MPIDPYTIIQRWFDEVWNHGRESTIDELFAAEAIAHGLGEGGNVVRGPAGVKAFVRNMRSAFPDVHITVEDTIVHEDKAAARVLVQGTNLGDGLGMPATGRRVSVTGIVIIRVAGGQIAEGWNNWDQLGLLHQLGAIPEPKAADRFLPNSASA